MKTMLVVAAAFAYGALQGKLIGTVPGFEDKSEKVVFYRS